MSLLGTGQMFTMVVLRAAVVFPVGKMAKSGERRWMTGMLTMTRER